jgi:hypothetical protein
MEVFLSTYTRSVNIEWSPFVCHFSVAYYFWEPRTLGVSPVKTCPQVFHQVRRKRRSRREERNSITVKGQEVPWIPWLELSTTLSVLDLSLSTSIGVNFSCLLTVEWGRMPKKKRVQWIEWPRWSMNLDRCISTETDVDLDWNRAIKPIFHSIFIRWIEYLTPWPEVTSRCIVHCSISSLKSSVCSHHYTVSSFHSYMQTYHCIFIFNVLYVSHTRRHPLTRSYFCKGSQTLCVCNVLYVSHTRRNPLTRSWFCKGSQTLCVCVYVCVCSSTHTHTHVSVSMSSVNFCNSRVCASISSCLFFQDSIVFVLELLCIVLVFLPDFV